MILIGDGMADYPIPEYGGRTALQIACTPNLDFITGEGICGLVRTIPPDMDAGSDIATLSILGYDPARYYTGRGPLEAIGMNIPLDDTDIAFRCNLITESGGKIVDYSGGHISDADAKELIESLNLAFKSWGVRFYPGVSYRNIMVLKAGEDVKGGAPPHEIIGEDVGAKLPESRLLRDIILRSRQILDHHIANERRAAQNKNKANMVWLWSGGRKPVMPEFKDVYGVTGAMISGVYLVKGVARCVGMDVIDVPGATGYIDTNYEGKAEYALRSLEQRDLVLVHVEAPDEAAHSGDIEQKVKAIENFDRLVVGKILRGLESEYADYKVLALPDHYTPTALKVHTREPVPFGIYDSRSRSHSGATFDEISASKSPLRLNSYRKDLMRYLFQ